MQVVVKYEEGWLVRRMQEPEHPTMDPTEPPALWTGMACIAASAKRTAADHACHFDNGWAVGIGKEGGQLVSCYT